MDDAADDRLRRAGFLADAHRPAEALHILASVRASDPGSSRAHLLAARCFFELGRFGEAVDAANVAASCAPEWSAPHILRSQAYGRLGDHHSAMNAAAVAVRLAPNSGDAHMVLAQALAQLGNTKEGLVHARQAVGLAPRSAEAFVALSFVALKARQWRECETAARHALELNPNSSGAMNNLGVALRHRWRPLAAIRMFGSAVRANPTGRLSHGNANGSIMRLGGWVLCLFVSTIVLLAWLLQGSPQLSHSALLGLFTASAFLTLIVVVAGIVWVVRLPRAVRRSLRDTSAWIQTFGGRPDGAVSVMGRVAWFVVGFFGIPLVFVLVFVWNALRVIQGSERRLGETPEGILAYPAVLAFFAIALRTASVRAAMKRQRGLRRDPAKSSE
jgi:tetratricopeptide (TPR) repeat protein